MTARRGARGQVLLVAVLVLFAVASVAALLAAIVGAQVVQVTRYADVTELRSAAESILRLANEQLTYSWQGADWRPAPDAPPYRCGKALVDLTVSYQPMPGNIESRFMLITVAARFPDNPFLRYTKVAWKPLLLTDYARFITDRYELRQPASLGVSGVELGGQPRPNTSQVGGYEFIINGPIRSNTDLEWYGRSRVNLFTPAFVHWLNLGLLRDDRIEVAGSMRPALRPGQPDVSDRDEPSLEANPLDLWVDNQQRTNNVFKPNTEPERLLYLSGFADEPYGSVTNTWRVLADLPPYTTLFAGTAYPPALSVPRVQPPRMDAVHPEMHTNRYLIITRDSGKWATINRALVNTGAHGWGWANRGGIYLDNYEDIQYNHDLEKLRLNWTGGFRQPYTSADGRQDSTTPLPADWWDYTGRYYAPPGVELILHGEAPCPYIEVIRHTVRYVPLEGGARSPYYWRDELGGVIELGAPPVVGTADTSTCPWFATSGVGTVHDNIAVFPFPPNGVIYAEGNVRVRGIMPPNGNIPGIPPERYADWQSTAGNGRAINRCYDLSIVSGGTIYIEGDLLSATAARQYDEAIEGDAAKVAAFDRDFAARLALIARDNVCVNTTAFQLRPEKIEGRDPHGNVLNDSQPIYPPASKKAYPPYMFFKGKEGVSPDNTPDGTPVVTDPASAAFVYWNARVSLAPQLARLKAALPPLQMFLGHSGWYLKKDTDLATQPNTGSPDNKALVQVKRSIGTNPWPWAQGEEQYTFRVRGSGEPTHDVSEHWYKEPDRLDPFQADDYLEFLPAGVETMPFPINQLTSAPYQFTFTPQVVPVRRLKDPGPPPVYEWVVAPDELGYVLGPLAVAPLRDKDPLPVEIDALVYAQNGSWFILAGPWFNEDPDEVYDFEAGGSFPDYPLYHEPLNMAVQFLGAISENMPAPIGDVADWTSKWAGPYGAKSGFLSYTYDPVLRYCRGTGANLRPIFPNLPLTPDLLIWGEQVAGVGGAGT